MTTCFNEAAWIDHCIRSVLAQTVPVQQHVVVNDGSTDDSQARLDQYQHLNVVEVTNRGMPAARNAGLLNIASEVEWVIMLDGDDWLEPNFVDECWNAAADADVVFAARRKHPGPATPQLPRVLHPSEAQLWERCHGTSCAMIRRRLLANLGGFHPACGGDCDWDFWIDAARRNARFAYTDRTHYHYRIRPDSYSRTDAERLQPGHVDEMRRHHHPTGYELALQEERELLDRVQRELDRIQQ